MPHNACVQLQICPVLIRRGLRAYGIETFSNAKEVIGLLEKASFTNLNSVVERIPISGFSSHSEEDLGEHFTHLLSAALSSARGVAEDSGEPQRSSRLSMIEEVQAALWARRNSHMDFMNLVRITAQKSSNPFASPSGSPRAT